jgi:hypothetical protein
VEAEEAAALAAESPLTGDDLVASSNARPALIREIRIASAPWSSTATSSPATAPAPNASPAA